jgi:N-dimethylarginine dimethylaminohydrolase
LRDGIGVFSDYGKLHEVVVGIPDGLTLPPFSPDLGHYNSDLRTRLEACQGRPLDIQEAFPERWDEAVAQMEGVVRIFEDFGVRVQRPRPFSAAESGYLRELQPGKSQLYPADPVFVLGKHFLELNVRRAYRRKEIFPLRELILPRLAGDKDARYAAIPAAAPFDPSGGGPGPYLEGGDILITGKDIIVGQGALCSDAAGFAWLESLLVPGGYRVTPLPIVDDILHALGIICLLREGLAMAYLEGLPEGLPAPLADWEIIEITREECLGHATVGVSLDPAHYMIDPRFGRIMEELSRKGIEPVPTPCEAIGFWGGAIRCITLPLRRDP